jgi:hypothetical protein
VNHPHAAVRTESNVSHRFISVRLYGNDFAA